MEDSHDPWRKSNKTCHFSILVPPLFHPLTVSHLHRVEIFMVFVIRSTKSSRNLGFDDPHVTFPSINRTEKDISNLMRFLSTKRNRSNLINRKIIRYY